jgi:hypothetical protein
LAALSKFIKAFNLALKTAIPETCHLRPLQGF